MFLIIFCAAALDVKSNVNAQEKQASKLRIYYEKLPDNDLKISVILIKGKGKDMVGIENAEIFLTALGEEEELPLTSIFTDVNGEADLYIESGFVFPKNEKGFAVVNALYNGNDSLESSDKKVKFKDLNVDVSFDIVDSVKHITVFAYEVDSVGEKTPVEEIGFKIGVERLHSTLYLEEVETDDEGIAYMEFPNDIPGDSLGNITVIVFAEEKKYGTVTKAIVSDWGTIVDFSITSNGRSLFGDEAPLWMTISIFVILIGAWFHFIFAGFKVYKMSKSITKVDAN